MFTLTHRFKAIKMTRRFLFAAAAAALLAAATPAVHASQSVTNLFCPQKCLISIVDFEASWCTPCKMMKPAWARVERDYKGRIAFVHIDIDKNPEISQALRISSVPTQILFDRKCKLIDAHSGYLPEEDLRATFDHVLKKY